MAAMLIAATVTTAIVTSPTARVGAAAPPPCMFPNNPLGQCSFYPGPGPRGSIGLIGDSVLDGSADGASSPGLPSLLSKAGWGPIQLVATLGMRTYWDLTQYPGPKYQNTSGVWWVQHWHAAHFYPSVVVVNLGNNHLGECTRATFTVCKLKIDRLLDVIGPSATVWWSKINYNAALSKLNPNYETSLAWNMALDRAAAERKNLVVWDWPTALATSNPHITVDGYGIHPVSSVEYVKRSRLMLAHIGTYMPAHFAGPPATLPAFVAAGLHFEPYRNTTATGAVVLTPTSLAAGHTLDLALHGRPSIAAAALAVALTVNVTSTAAAGSLTAYRCGDARPATVNLTFAAHAARAGLVIARLSGAGHVCLYSSAAITVSADAEGSLVQSGAADALATTGNAHSIIAPANAAPGVIHTPVGDAVTADLTVKSTGGRGSVTVHECGQPVPVTATLLYSGTETVTASVIAHTSPAHTICVVVSPSAGTRPTVIIDQHHVFRRGPGLTYTPVAPVRLLDTRTARGGWYGRHTSGLTLSVAAAPAAARLLVGSVTMAGPLAAGSEHVAACGAVAPPWPAVSAAVGSIATSTLLIAVAAKVCITTDQNTQTAFDLFGWWS